MAHWEEVMNRINSGDMPPKGKPRPAPADVARVAEWITGQLAEAEARRQAAGGERVALRRLTREEYANTVRDLLGVTFDAADPAGLPEDPDWHGFQRIGSVLTLSPAHVEKYLAAAEAVLDEALPTGPRPEREVVRWGAFDLRGGSWKKYEKEYQARGIADQVRADIVPNNGALDDHTLQVKTTGDYLVRVKLSGLRPDGGRAPRLRLYDATIGRLLFERDVEAPEKAPTTIEFRTHLPAGSHNIRIMNAVPGPNPEDRRSRSSEVPNAFTGLRSRVPWQMKFTDDDGKPIVPFLLIDSDRVGRPGPRVVADPGAPAGLLRRRVGDPGRGLRPADPRPLRRAGVAAAAAARRAGPPRRRCSRRRGRLGDGFEAAVKTALLGGPHVEGLPLPRRRERRGPLPAARRLGAGVPAVVLPVEFDARRAAVRPGPRRARCTGPRSSGPRSGGCSPTRRPPRSPSRSPGSGCNCGRWACSPPTGRSTPSTTSTSKRA